jgi:putative endonuclease
MASQLNGTIYLGVTSDLPARVYQHRNGLVEGFTKKYGCKRLVWYEVHDELESARYRELQLKKWNRQWKLRLIEEKNPDWDDLFESLF